MAELVSRPVTLDDLAQLRRLYAMDYAVWESPLNTELSGYSAEEALKYLMRNWEDAQRDDAQNRARGLRAPKFTTASILSDIDDVIDQLRLYRGAAEKLLVGEDSSMKPMPPEDALSFAIDKLTTVGDADNRDRCIQALGKLLNDIAWSTYPNGTGWASVQVHQTGTQ